MTVTIQYSLNSLVMYVFLPTTHPLLLAQQTPDSVFTLNLQQKIMLCYYCLSQIFSPCLYRI